MLVRGITMPTLYHSPTYQKEFRYANVIMILEGYIITWLTLQAWDKKWSGENRTNPGVVDTPRYIAGNYTIGVHDIILMFPNSH